MIGSVAASVALLAGSLGQGAPSFDEMPKIDVHAHYFDDMPEFAKMLQRIDMKAVVVCVFKDRPVLLDTLESRAALVSKKYSPQIHFASTFDLTNLESPEYPREVADWLDKTFADGAVMTKIWKEVGMATRRADGTFVMPDAPELDPVYAHLALRNKPLMAHFGDPIEAWQPLTPGSMHYTYFSSNSDWHMHGRAGYPSHADIMAAVDRMLEKHPDLTVIGAHLGSLEHDLEALGRRFDRFPNYYVDVSARTPDLRRYPNETIRDFFVKYQDRILYGLDQGVYTASRDLSKDEQVAYAERMEEWYRREFAYYAGSDLGLPRAVLEKFYHGNAQRLLELRNRNARGGLSPRYAIHAH